MRVHSASRWTRATTSGTRTSADGLAGSLPIAPAAGRRGKHANIEGLHSRLAGPIERAVIVFVSAVLQSLSVLLVGVFASAAVQRYVFGHATAEFVDVVFFVVLGALFTATTH